jgi:hypothetical protein
MGELGRSGTLRCIRRYARAVFKPDAVSRHREAAQGRRSRNPGNARETRSVVYDNTAQPGTKSVAEVERGDVEAGGHVLTGAFSLAQNAKLKWCNG